jgi:hypothetical protein
MGRRPEAHGAISHLDGAFAMFAAGLAIDDDLTLASMIHARLLADTMEPWCAPRRYLNFEEHPSDASQFFDDETHRRLRSIKARVDPRNVIHANHPIEP